MQGDGSLTVAVFGGSFDPPHAAHVLAVGYLLAVGGFDRVLVVPVYSHAFDKHMVGFEHRARMCELAVDFMSGAWVSRIEERLERPNYTLRTVQALSEQQPEWRLRLAVGSDVLHVKDQWYAFDEVARLAPPYVLGRVGADHAEAPPPVLPDISSTRIRELLEQRQQPRVRDELARYVPRAVLDYIDRGALYDG